MKQPITIFNRSITLITMLIIIGLVVSCANPIPAKETTITFAANAFIKGFYPSLASLADEFHRQNPFITVQIVNPPEEDWNKSDLSDLASAADATLLSPSLEKPTANAAYFKDLAPLMSGDSTFKADDFWPGLLTAYQDGQGKTVGLPMGIYGIGIYYDPKSFDAAGLAYPAPGWTGEEFQRDITALTGASGGSASLGFVDATGFGISVLVPAVDHTLEATNGKLDPAVLSGQLQWYLEQAKAGSLFSFDQSAESRSALFKDKVPGMWVGGFADPSPTNAGRLARQDYGLLPFPVSVDVSNDHTTPQLTVCGVISAASAHPQEAWAWLDFLTRQKPVDTGPNHVIPQIPARQSVADASQYWEGYTPQAEAAAKYSLAHGWYGSLYPQTLNRLGDALGRVLAGQQDLSLALSQAAALPGQATPTPGTVAAVATPGSTLSVSSDTITINFSPPNMPPGDTTFQKLADAFHKLHPNIVVNVITDETVQCFTVQYCLNGQIDTFSAGLGGTNLSTITDKLYALDPFIASGDPGLLNDFFPGTTDIFTSDGKLYALPSSADMPLVYYNPDLLAQKGLQPPSGSWTVDDFIKLATAVASGGGPGVLTAEDVTAEQLGTPDPKLDQVFGAAMVDSDLLNYLAKGWIDYSSDPPVVNLNQPQVIAAVKQVSDLIKQGVILYGGVAASDPILRGRVGLWFDTGDISTGPSIFPSNINIGVALIPQGIEQVFYDIPTESLRTTGGLFIARTTKNPQACWEWISFLSADSSSFLGVPVRRSVAASTNWEARVGSENATVYRTALAKIPTAQDYAWNDTIEAYQNTLPIFFLHNVLGKIVLLGGDPVAVLKEEQNEIDTYLACIAPLNLSSIQATPGMAQQISDCFQNADPYKDNLPVF